MRKILLVTAIGALGLTGAAQASKPTHPAHPVTGHHQKQNKASHHQGYNAVGTLVSSTLTPSATGHHRYSGTIVVNVTRANHCAPTGSQTFTLTDAKVKFHRGVDPSAPAAGDRVGLHGTITGAAKGKCSSGSTATPTITVRHADIRVAKPAKPAKS